LVSVCEGFVAQWYGLAGRVIGQDVLTRIHDQERLARVRLSVSQKPTRDGQAPRVSCHGDMWRLLLRLCSGHNSP
jgi:hypothetical protein